MISYYENPKSGNIRKPPLRFCLCHVKGSSVWTAVILTGKNSSKVRLLWKETLLLESKNDKYGNNAKNAWQKAQIIPEELTAFVTLYNMI